ESSTPADVTRARAKFGFGPFDAVPPIRILPEPSTAIATQVSVDPKKSTVARPPIPKLASRTPVEENRTMTMSWFDPGDQFPAIRMRPDESMAMHLPSST